MYGVDNVRSSLLSPSLNSCYYYLANRNFRVGTYLRVGSSCRARAAPLRGCPTREGSAVSIAQPVPQRGTFMSTHSLFAEDRHEAPLPAAKNDNLTSIDQALLNLLRRYENEELAEAWIIAQRWPNGVHCPECGSDDIAEPPDRIPMPYRCRSCRTQFSVKSHSALKASKLPLSVWVQALHICSALSNPDAVDIRDVLPVTNKSGWNLAMRIHESWEFRRSGERNRRSRRRPS